VFCSKVSNISCKMWMRWTLKAGWASEKQVSSRNRSQVCVWRQKHRAVSKQVGANSVREVGRGMLRSEYKKRSEMTIICRAMNLYLLHRHQRGFFVLYFQQSHVCTGWMCVQIRKKKLESSKLAKWMTLTTMFTFSEYLLHIFKYINPYRWSLSGFGIIISPFHSIHQIHHWVCV
jgi:hypothetical protein